MQIAAEEWDKEAGRDHTTFDEKHSNLSWWNNSQYQGRDSKPKKRQWYSIAVIAMNSIRVPRMLQEKPIKAQAFSSQMLKRRLSFKLWQ